MPTSALRDHCRCGEGFSSLTPPIEGISEEPQSASECLVFEPFGILPLVLPTKHTKGQERDARQSQKIMLGCLVHRSNEIPAVPLNLMDLRSCTCCASWAMRRTHLKALSRNPTRRAAYCSGCKRAAAPWPTSCPKTSIFFTEECDSSTSWRAMSVPILRSP